MAGAQPARDAAGRAAASSAGASCGRASPLYRVGVFVRTLHPNVAGRGFIWQRRPGRGGSDSRARLGIGHRAVPEEPDPRVVFTQHTEVRRRLADPRARWISRSWRTCARRASTDFFALPLRFITGEVHGASFATRRPGGFTEAEMAGLRADHAALIAASPRSMSWRRKAATSSTPISAGRAGEKVLAGQIRRGDGEEMHAVIWFCDLRDSTPLADSMSREAFLRLLNEFFECVLGPVLERQGEMLRFIGDAALAIFPVGSDPGRSLPRGRSDAAKEAMERMEAANAERSARCASASRLHLGDVALRQHRHADAHRVHGDRRRGERGGAHRVAVQGARGAAPRLGAGGAASRRLPLARQPPAARRRRADGAFYAVKRRLGVLFR